MDKKKNNEKKADISVNYLYDPSIMYLSESGVIKCDKVGDIGMEDLCLFQIDEVCFEDKAPRREALENVLSAMRIDGVNFIFLIVGDKKGVKFYYGASRDNRCKGMKLSINDIGEYILSPGIKGNFRGSKVIPIAPDEKRSIVKKIGGMKYSGIIEGVPGANKNDEKFQSVDRLVDVMLGDEFCFMVIAKPLNIGTVLDIQRDMYTLYSQLLPLSKKSIQNASSTNEGRSKGTTKGTTEGKSTSISKSESSGTSDSVATNSGHGTSITNTIGTTKSTGTSSSSGTSSTSSGGSESKATGSSTSNGTTETKGTSETISKTTGSSDSVSTSISGQESESSGTSSSESTTVEFGNKEVQDWIKYLDEVIIPRLDYGKGKGVFVTSIALFTNISACMQKLENTAISLYSGETGNRVPLKAMPLSGEAERAVKNFSLPYGKISGLSCNNEKIAHSAMSQVLDKDGSGYIGNWITTNELGVVSGLPQKEVVGLRLKEEVEFGLNSRCEPNDDSKIELGNLVQSGNVLSKNPVYMDRNVLDQHIFIAGVTGSGKTTTCQNLIHASGLPFLVIEPAKTEYRILKEDFDDLLVFTLGNNTVAPLKMNPFVFYPHESITSRVDMIKACIESAFDMEAAIPQIIESAIYLSYEQYGWNISTNKNSRFDKPFEKGVNAFPTLSDLIANCTEVVKRQGFDERLKNDYIGSINARLQGLMVGSKGLMLNTHHSIDFEELLDQRVVLELEEIRSGSEKSLIMGFILINLAEAIKAKYMKNGRFSHLTLVEEAHRLLSKYQPGDDPNKRHGVEMFADMLAEIRKYGESLIIVDQIPNKLTSEVLKNTNTKIIHRIFAEDDKEAIGNTIMLNKEQKEFLSNLDTGRAIFYSTGYDKAVQVQIKQSSDTSRRSPEDSELVPIVYEFYRQHYKDGFIMGLEMLDEMPSNEMLECFIALENGDELAQMLKCFEKTDIKPSKELINLIAKYIDVLGIEFLCDYMRRYCLSGYLDPANIPLEEIVADFVAGKILKGQRRQFVQEKFLRKI